MGWGPLWREARADEDQSPIPIPVGCGVFASLSALGKGEDSLLSRRLVADHMGDPRKRLIAQLG